ncbi:MAG: hypothetical protein ACR2LR_08345 [Hassallia sp.]
MKILPNHTSIISTSDSLSIVLQRLNAKVEPPKVFRFYTRHAALYEGTISSEGFQINRIIQQRKSFSPIIRGRFEVQSHQTLVHVQISMSRFVKASLPLGYLIWVSMLFSSLRDSISLHTIILCVGLPLVLLIICLVAFWSEAKSNRNELSQIIKGEVHHY